MVRCADCGFLGLRRGDGELIEVDYRYRKEGERDVPRDYPEWHPASARRSTMDVIDEQTPRCFARPEVDFAARRDVLFPGPQRLPSQIVPVLEEDWHCPAFYLWRPGRDPSEHMAMRERELINRREDERDAAMRKREDERDAAMWKREDERDARVEMYQTKLHNRELLIIGGLVTIMIVTSTLVAAIIEGAVSRGWEPGWWWF